jgi:hypothetical protein
MFFAVTEHNLFIINVLRDFLAGRTFWLRLSEAKPRQANSWLIFSPFDKIHLTPNIL